MPKFNPRSMSKTAMDAIKNGTAFRILFLHDMEIYFPLTITKNIIGNVPTPNADINKIACKTSAVANAPANATYTKPHGKNPFKNPIK